MQCALLLPGAAWRGRVPEGNQPSLSLRYRHFNFYLESESGFPVGRPSPGRSWVTPGAQFYLLALLWCWVGTVHPWQYCWRLWDVFGGGLLLFFLFRFALRAVIVYLRPTEISSTFQRNETKSKGLYCLSQTANRIMKYFQTINGDCWHMIRNKEICCFNLWLTGNAAANPRKEREEQTVNL